MEQVSRSVFVNVGHGECTVGAIQTAVGTVLVDSPAQPTRARSWLTELKPLGEVRYLINTEHHIDHTFGNAFLPGVVIANRVTKERFWEDSVVGPNPMKDPISFVRRIDPKGEPLVADYRAKGPEIVFDESLRLFMDGITIDAFVVAGHTEAETAVFVREEGVLFTSDNIFNGVMTWYHESLPFEWLETLEKLSRMPIEVVVPGHGEPGGPELLETMHEVVRSALNEVEIAIASGMSRDEAIEDVSFSDWDRVPEGHKHVAERMQKIFVGRVFDQVAARR